MSLFYKQRVYLTKYHPKLADATLFSSFLDFILILHCFRGNDCHEPQVTLNFENEILTVLTNGIFFVVE